jgi:DNA-binding Lrp family transcriptional regulator
MKDIRVLSIFQAENPGVPSNLTKTDLEIIDKLIKDPRSKIEDIAKFTKLSSKTVARSLEKFQRDDTILFTLIYDPIKLKAYIPYAIVVEIKNNFKDTLNNLIKKFSNSFLQKPFVAKNQIVLFMYSDDIFKLDLLTQQVRELSGVTSADLFIPKKINLPTNWVIDTIKKSKVSKKLHLLYQTP